MAVKEEILITLDFETDDFNKQAADLNKNIKELNQQQKELKKQGQEGSIQFAENANALRENKKELRETNKTIDNLTKANNAAAGSNEQLKAQLSLQTAEYNKLSKAERENSERGKELNAQINKTTEDLKSNEEAVGDNRRSVGDYGKALGATPFGSFVSGIKSMGAAFLANPLAIIILAIVGAFKLLREAFVSTEKGQNKLAKVMNVLGTIFTKLFDVLEPLADFIFDSVIKAFEDLAAVAESAAGLVSDALAMFGFDEAAKGLDNFVDSANQAAKAAALVSDARAKSDKLERELTVESAKAQAQVAEARRKSNDIENVAAEDRKAALVEAAALTDELAAKREAAATLRLKALQLENSLTNSNKEALEAEAEAEAELIRIQTQRSNIQKGLLTDQKRVNNEIKKENAARQKAAADAVKRTIDQHKQELDLFIAQQGIRAKTLAEEVALAEQIRDKELAILEEQRNAKLVSETEFQTQKLEIQQEFLLKQTELTIDNAQMELDAIVAANESKLEANQFLNDELFAQEQMLLENKAQARRDFEQTRLDEGVISEQEYNDSINAINEENEIAQADLAAEKQAADDEQALVDLENQREIDILNREDEFLLRQQDLDRQRNQELDNAQATGADVELINKKFDKFDKELTKDKRKAQVSEAAAAFQAIGGLAAGNAQAEKALAISSSIINGFQGVTAVLAAKSTIPEPFGSVLKGITATAIGATALINVNKIRSTPIPKAARGTVIGGKPHSLGGTKGYFDDGTSVEVEKGELLTVVNAKNTGLLSKLDALNTFGGNGDSFFGRGGAKSFLQDGGIALSGVTSSVDNELESIGQVVAAVESLPQPVVAVQDINEIQDDTAEVEVRAEV